MTQLDDISFKLGQLFSELKAVRGDIEEVKEDAQKEREASTKYRQGVREDLASVGDSVRAVDQKIAPLSTRVVEIEKKIELEIEPQVESYKTFRAQIGVGVLLAGAIASGAAYLVWQGIQAFGPEMKKMFMNLLR